jgi:hypothetical protein
VLHFGRKKQRRTERDFKRKFKDCFFKKRSINFRCDFQKKRQRFIAVDSARIFIPAIDVDINDSLLRKIGGQSVEVFDCDERHGDFVRANDSVHEKVDGEYFEQFSSFALRKSGATEQNLRSEPRRSADVFGDDEFANFGNFL